VNWKRKLVVFILSLPLLALALVWIPIGLVFAIVISPIWGLLGLIAMAKGEDPMWETFLMPPLIVLSMYAETTGLIPNPLP